MKGKCRICASEQLDKVNETPFYDLIRCQQCKVIFKSNKNVNFADVDNDKYCYVSEEIKTFQKKFFRWRFNTVVKFFKESSKLLDVGCSTGAFLETGIEYGWDATGIDISRNACSIASNVKKAKVHCAKVEDMKFPDNEFLLIHISHVLEHISDPVSFLSEIRRILHPSGIIFIEVPNERFYMLRKKIIRALNAVIEIGGQSDDRNHLYYFNPSSLKILIENAGFKIKSIDVKGYAYPGRLDITLYDMKKPAKKVFSFLAFLKPDELIGLGHYIEAIAKK